jgi:hypothetical protein
LFVGQIARCKTGLMGVLLATILFAPAVGEGASCDCYSEFWVINSRCAPICQGVVGGVSKLKFRRYVEKEGWRDATLAEFVESGRDLPTVFYAHGNGLSHSQAMSAGWSMYGELKRCCNRFRYVLWSWPAEKATRGVINNMRIKSVRAEHQGYYMAWVINRMLPHPAPISVSGHSLGGITACVAAHYLGGGVFRGRQLASWPAPEEIDFRVVMISAAADNDAMLPGRPYGAAFKAADRVVVLFNPRDRTLKFWPKVSFRGAQAISKSGMASPWRLGEDRAKLEQYTTTGEVGGKHRFKVHFQAPGVMAQVRDAFFSPIPNAIEAAVIAPPPPE